MHEDNVKVAVRLRPLLPKEKLSGDHECVHLIPNSSQLVLGKDRPFTFDFAFSTKTTQEEMYVQCVEPMVRSVFDGYNSTVFAYGQTGSGKTFTIGGGDISSLTEDEYGVIPRALRHMFQVMESKDGVSFDVHVSYIEIYKEELRDLLDIETSTRDLHVREDQNGNTVIVGAIEERVQSLDEVMYLLECGSAARHTASTQMNEYSSRSHSVFTVVIGQRWINVDSRAEKKDTNCLDDASAEELSCSMCGKFHFVDLAGSERAHRTGNIGTRFKESIHINSGLLSLGNVISVLGDPKKKSNHIPYRDSKITRILKDSLGGNARTVMICCISPASCDFDETLNALKYANRARNIKNKPIINRDIQSTRMHEMQSEIMALREELQRQRTYFESGVSDGNDGKETDSKIFKLEAEREHYLFLVDQAYDFFLAVQGQCTLPDRLSLQMQDWFLLLEEIRDSGTLTANGNGFRSENSNMELCLKKHHLDVNGDKALSSVEVKHLEKQIIRLKEQLADQVQRNTECQQRIQQQEHLLMQQEMKIRDLQNVAMADRVQEYAMICSESLIPSCIMQQVSAERPTSLPAKFLCPEDVESGDVSPRRVKTSPADMSLDHVMQNFRARSRLLVTWLEDGDEVRHPTFSDEGEEEADGGRRILHRRETFQVKKSTMHNGSCLSTDASYSAANDSTMQIDGDQVIDLNGVTNVDLQQKQIKQCQLKMLEMKQKVRDLSVNIRMKQQLICELVKSGNDADLMNKQYEVKIRALEMEREHACREVLEMQTAIRSLETRKQEESLEKSKLRREYERKIGLAKQRMAELQAKQKDTEKVAQFANHHDNKIRELERAVERMKQQHGLLERKLKGEGEQKAKLERDMQRESQRVKSLEIRNEQQQKILKRKTEEVAAAQRRLRCVPPSCHSANTEISHTERVEINYLEEQGRFLDSEIERVLIEKSKMIELQEELHKRECILSKREAMLCEKSELEMKKLRSSMVLNKELGALSEELHCVDRRLEEERQCVSNPSSDHKHAIADNFQELEHRREQLNCERHTLDGKLHDGFILSSVEERKLIELEEGMEALDAALQYRNEAIQRSQMELRQSQTLAVGEEQFSTRLCSLPVPVARSLLALYFDKVVGLREMERDLKLQNCEMEVKQEETERFVRELEGALQRAGIDLDRRLTQQQQAYERKIQLLVHQLTGDTRNSDGVCPVDEERCAVGSDVDEERCAVGPDVDEERCAVGRDVDEGRCAVGRDVTDRGPAKVHHLERELFFYKKSSRDLKKKVRHLFSTGKISQQVAKEIGVLSASVRSGPGQVDLRKPDSNHQISLDRQVSVDHPLSEYHHMIGKFHVSGDHLAAERSTDRLIESRYTKSMPPNTDPRSSEMTGGRRGHRSDNKQVMSVDNTGSKSVKIARRELRAMSTEEVSTRRRSNLNNGSVDSQMKFLNSSNHHFNDSLESSD